MFNLNCKGRLLSISKPIVMGIINITPDSFYSGSQKQREDLILETAEKMLEDGATLLDIGGQSTRPGSITLSAEEELKRVLPAIYSICHHFPEALLSIDTYYSKVAAEAIAAGACMVNDVSSGNMDKDMIPTVGQLKVPYVAMHMKGTPATMQQLNKYDDLILDMLDFFINKTAECHHAGIHDIIIDPGFGFAKNIEQNFLLLKKLNVFKILQKPILTGLSRKSTIYKTLNTTPEHALNGTTVLNTVALSKGANILRVHDVKEAMETITLLNEMV